MVLSKRLYMPFMLLTVLLTPSALPTVPVDAPLDLVSEQTDFWVRGQLVSVQSKVLTGEVKPENGRQGDLEITALFHVIDSDPEMEPSDVTVRWACPRDYPGGTGGVGQGDYIAALKRHSDGTFGVFWSGGVGGWIRLDPATGTCRRLDRIGDSISSDLMWELVTAVRSGLDAPAGLDSAVIATWMSRLQSGDLHEFAAAQLLFDAIPGGNGLADALISGFEKQCADGQGAALRRYLDIKSVLPVTLGLLQRVGTPSTTKRLIDLCERDFASTKSVFDDTDICRQIVRVVCACGGDERVAQLTGLLNKEYEHFEADGKSMGERRPLRSDYGIITTIGEFRGQDIDSLLVDMLHRPAEFGINDSLALAGVWQTLALRGNPGFKDYLDRLFTEPTAFQLGIEREESREMTLASARESAKQYALALPRAEGMRESIRLYKRGQIDALAHVFESMTMEDEDLVPELAAIPLAHLQGVHYRLADAFCTMAARVPDPAFLPQLRGLAETSVHENTLVALHTCGERDLARSLATDIIKRRLSEGDLRALMEAASAKSGALRFLGWLGDPKAARMIEPFTRASLLKKYRLAFDAAERADKQPPLHDSVGTLERSAILALARAGGGDAIPRLREIYEEGDTSTRVTVSMALCALGDATGQELVRLFAERRELENPELAQVYQVTPSTTFYEAARYLEDPETDAVLEKRLTYGFDSSDQDVLAYSRFMEANKPLVLHALVENLGRRDISARREAVRVLEYVTHQKFEYDPLKPVRVQQAAIAQWQEWISTNFGTIAPSK